eukprot:1004408_1
MDPMFGFDDSEFSDRTLCIVEPDGRPRKRTRSSENSKPEGKIVHVSKFVLCSQSEYFKNLLGKRFAESKETVVEVCVGKDETNAMLKLLLCFYDRLSPDNKDKLSLEDCSTDELISIIRLADMVQAPASVLITVAKALSDKELCIESCERMIRLPDHITGCEGFKAIKETQWPEWYKTSFRKKLLVSIITINRKSYGRLLGLLGLGKCRTNRTEGFGESFFSLSKFKDWLDGSRKFERFIVRSLPMIMSLVVEDNDDVFFVMRLDFDKTALSYVDEDGKTKIGVQISNLSVDGVSVDVNDDFSQVLDFKRSSKLRICIGKKGDLKPESIVKIVVEGV